MSFGELMTWVLVAAVGIWVFNRVRRAMHADRDWSSQLQDFAEDKALVPHTVDRGPGVHELNTTITWKSVKSWWSRNPAMDRPPSDSTIFTGRSNGLSISMDTVLIRKRWSNLYDEYVRMAAEIPDLPHSLTIRPKGRIGRLARHIGFGRAYRGAVHPSNLTVSFSSDVSDRNAEQMFLSMDRLRTLDECEKRVGGVYVYDGKVFLIKSRKDASQLSLNALYDSTIVLAERLVEAGSP